VIARLGQLPTKLQAVHYKSKEKAKPIELSLTPIVKDRKLVGIDVFAYWMGQDPDAFATMIQAGTTPAFELTNIGNRGTNVWPEGMKQTFKTNHWRCRFMAKNKVASNADVADLMKKLDEAGIDFIKTEQLYTFDGQEMFSKAQGE